ncbi:acyltransferase family protein [Xanthobacter autotrophicus]|uniref:acyltransferase family protein n=1 Tax=Xanthobacter TaxID=279 RepID=UPI0024AC1D5D|nr:acyltransferase family protein [Xanthobacter autotrophicus]MDI4665613.1 acyltransferase family protein [Xanthobacter autotrophicus]
MRMDRHGTADGESPAPLRSAPLRQRAAWVDGAKGISICLVVLWHTAGIDLPLNNLLIFVRMPLFFFAAGFFSGKAINSGWRTLLADRAFNYYYIYALWMTIFFITIVVVRDTMHGAPPTFADYFLNFIDPLEYLWFIFALALLFVFAKLVSPLPKPLVIGTLLIVYAISVHDGQWEPLTFQTRMERLPLFFILGGYLYPYADTYARRLKAWWPVTLALFLAFTLLVLGQHLEYIAVLTLTASALGLFTVCQFCQATAQTPVGAAMGFIGRNTIYIYLLHKILIVYLVNVLEATGLSGLAGNPYLIFALVLPASLVLGLALQRGAPWLFEAPWVLRRRGEATA